MHPSDLLGERFLFERLAGTGGMGKVYKAVDTKTGHPVAIKVLSASAAPEGKAADDGGRLAREASILAELRHPNIVRYIEHGTLRGAEPYLVMEWLDGEDLACRLTRGPLPPAKGMYNLVLDDQDIGMAACQATQGPLYGTRARASTNGNGK